jgi:hypothetical protein
MKKILMGLVGLLFLMIPVLGLSAPVSSTSVLTFEWEQDVASLEQISGWVLYESTTPGTGYVKVTDITYTGPATTTYTSDVTITVSGTAGSTVNRYYILKAKNKIVEGAEGSGLESDPSNEVAQAFIIPIPTPNAPFNLKIKVVVISK